MSSYVLLIRIWAAKKFFAEAEITSGKRSVPENAIAASNF